MSKLRISTLNCYLREIISFTKKMTLETGASLDPHMLFMIMLSNELFHLLIQQFGAANFEYQVITGINFQITHFFLGVPILS